MKRKKMKPIFEGSYLGNDIVECEVMMLAGISTAKIIWFR